MIWLVWRQHRAEGLVMLVVLVVAAVFLLISGMSMAHTLQDSGLSACLAKYPDGPDGTGPCAALSSQFLNQYDTLKFFASALLLLPILLGVMVGAPLVAREYEQHTELLVWMQSVSRTRWMIVTLALMVGTDVLAAGVLLALLNWWYQPFDLIEGKFNQLAFDGTGPVFIAAALMCLAVGIAVGTLTRRTVLAMFLTLALIAAVRSVVEFNLRPNYYLPPVVITWPFPDKFISGHIPDWPPQPPITLGRDDWQLVSGAVDPEGKYTNSLNCDRPIVPSTGTSPEANFYQCVESEGYRGFYLEYQPADRFWIFQWIETGIYLGISVLAMGVSVWWVRRRSTVE